jgi:hypothetical protein
MKETTLNHKFLAGSFEKCTSSSKNPNNPQPNLFGMIATSAPSTNEPKKKKKGCLRTWLDGVLFLSWCIVRLYILFNSFHFLIHPL